MEPSFAELIAKASMQRVQRAASRGDVTRANAATPPPPLPPTAQTTTSTTDFVPPPPPLPDKALSDHSAVSPHEPLHITAHLTRSAADDDDDDTPPPPPPPTVSLHMWPAKQHAEHDTPAAPVPDADKKAPHGSKPPVLPKPTQDSRALDNEGISNNKTDSPARSAPDHTQAHPTKPQIAKKPSSSKPSSTTFIPLAITASSAVDSSTVVNNSASTTLTRQPPNPQPPAPISVPAPAKIAKPSAPPPAPPIASTAINARDDVQQAPAQTPLSAASQSTIATHPASSTATVNQSSANTDTTFVPATVAVSTNLSLQPKQAATTAPALAVTRSSSADQLPNHTRIETHGLSPERLDAGTPTFLSDDLHTLKLQLASLQRKYGRVSVLKNFKTAGLNLASPSIITLSPHLRTDVAPQRLSPAIAPRSSSTTRAAWSACMATSMRWRQRSSKPRRPYTPSTTACFVQMLTPHSLLCAETTNSSRRFP